MVVFTRKFACQKVFPHGFQNIKKPPQGQEFYHHYLQKQSEFLTPKICSRFSDFKFERKRKKHILLVVVELNLYKSDRITYIDFTGLIIFKTAKSRF